MMLADTVRERLAAWLAKPGTDRNAQLDVSLRLFCKWRSALIQNMVQRHNGTRTWSGPFEGMDFLPRSTHSCHVSKLVGCYEKPLQVGARFTADDFAACAEGKMLVLCDIEGAERELLDPEAASALRGMDLIIESHDCLAAGTTKLLTARFQATHAITVVVDSGARRLPKVPPWFTRLGHLGQSAGDVEWRSGPMPWLVMKSRQEPGQTGAAVQPPDAAPAGPEGE